VFISIYTRPIRYSNTLVFHLLLEPILVTKLHLFVSRTWLCLFLYGYGYGFWLLTWLWLWLRFRSSTELLYGFVRARRFCKCGFPSPRFLGVRYLGLYLNLPVATRGDFIGARIGTLELGTSGCYLFCSVLTNYTTQDILARGYVIYRVK
jgi:hypothetical protein